jgi:YidC/Oxa1 family membrane protein insertase
VLAAGSILDPLYNLLGWILAFFYRVPPHSLGIAIILMTCVVMAVQLPLNAKQTRSMIQMQRVQPEIKKIQQKYKDDRTKQNEELLKFYQENKINPLAGCLPLLIIFPIGIAVFRLFLHGLQKHIPRTGSFNLLYSDLCGGAKTPVSECTKNINHHAPHAMYFLGMNLNWSAKEVSSKLSGHWIEWLPYYFLVGLVILTGWYQVRQTQARQLRQGNAAPNAQMQAVTRIMPILFGFITFGLSAATTLYFVTSNAFRIGQTHFVINKMFDEGVESGQLKPKGSGPEDKKPPDKKADKPPPQDAPPSKSGPKTRPADRDRNAPSGNGANGNPSNAARRKKKRKR